MNSLSSLAILLLACATVCAFADNSTANPNPSAKWIVYNPTNSSACILAEFNATFLVTYNATNIKTNETYIRNSTFDIPSTGVSVNRSDSYCNGGTVEASQRLTLDWTQNGYVYTVKVTFNRDSVNRDKTNVDSVSFLYDLRDDVTFVESTPTNASLQTASTNTVVASISGGMFLKCDSGVPAILMTLNPTQNFPTNVLFTMAKIQAFHQSNSSQFDGLAEVCAADYSTSSPATPTTSMPLTTFAPVNVGNYTLLNPNGTICLMAQFDLSVYVNYKQNVHANNETETRDAEGTISSVNNGTVKQSQSFCNDTDALLVIESFLHDWELFLYFSQASNKYSLHTVRLDFNLNDSSVINNATFTGRQTSNITGLNKWGTTVGHSYKCDAQAKWELNLMGVRNVTKLDLLLDHVQVQAFVSNTTTPGMFGEADVCPSNSPTSDVVPIAVGCALAALVVIVLIAYVIGRRRNRARGYESM